MVYRIAAYQNNNYSAEITRDLVSQSSPIRKEQVLFFRESNAEYSQSLVTLVFLLMIRIQGDTFKLIHSNIFQIIDDKVMIEKS